MPNKRTRELQAKVEASGISPLDYMLKLLRDEDEAADVRFEAAKAAAPYIHARLSAVDMKADVKTSLGDVLDAAD